MLQNRLFDVFSSVQGQKKDLKAERQRLTDILGQNDDYNLLLDKKTELQREMRNIVQSVILKEKIDIDVINNGIKNDIELLNDIATAQVIEDKTLPGDIEYGGEIYEPVITVKFRKK